jgi:hypothetical protein
MYGKHNYDLTNALEEITEDTEIAYYDPDPEEGDSRPETYLKDLFAGARLRRGERCDFSENEKIFSPSNYESFSNYLESVNYDSGYGGQNFFGFILLNDGTWYERHSYDGAEKWVHKKRPELHKTISKQ